jgi:DNA polymerase V
MIIPKLSPYDYIEKVISVIDLKSFYAVVECVERGLDPFTTPLVVADKTRGTGTIILAVSPFLRTQGIPSRLRVFELPKRDDIIFATPRMSLYLKRSAEVMSILLDFVGEEDLHVYSVDEAFLNLGPYLKLYKKSPEAIMLEIKETIYKKLKLLATVGIGDNAFLAKTALDIESKKTMNGIAYWHQNQIKEKMWPLSVGDMWGIARRLEQKLNHLGIFTIGDLAQYPKHKLHAFFGTMGEQLHDHANGIDLSDIREKYIPDEPGISMGQVLFRDYHPEEVPVVIREMCDDLTLRLRLEGKLTSLVHLSIGYSASMGGFSHQMSLIRATDDNDVLYESLMTLFFKYIEQKPVRNVTFAFRKLNPLTHEQLDLFVDPLLTEKKRKLQTTIAMIKSRYGHNAILRTSALLKSSTTIDRHTLIGGHRK